MARRLDRRVQRTRKLLRDAIMSLILEEGYDAISIQDITEKANLGRATFYLHHKDKDELLADLIWWMDDTKVITKLLDFAADHYDLYRILLIGKGGIPASRQLQRSIAEHTLSSIHHEIEETDIKPVAPTTFIANHFAGSLLSTIYWWLENDLSYSADELAFMIQNVNPMDREGLLGLDSPDQKLEPEKIKEKRKKKRNPKISPISDIEETSEDSPSVMQVIQSDVEEAEG